MKKNFIATLALLAIAGTVVSCGDQTNSDDNILEDSEYSWVSHGQFLLGDGETINAWNGKSAELYEKSKMEATSLTAIKAISEDVYTTLKGKSLKALYKSEVVLGVNDAGWTSNCMKDGKVYKANGSYCFKAAQCSIDYEPSETDPDTQVAVYAEQQWIPDPKTAHCESLTPSTLFMPVWQEAADDHGFSWASNPVCIGGAGKYALIAAQYTTVSSATDAGFGIGLVKLEEKDSTVGDYVEVKEYVYTDHTYGVAGSFEASGWADGKDIAMTASADGKSYSARVTLKADDQLKVRADGKWDYSWGKTGLGGDNFVVDSDGDYLVTIKDFGTDASAAVTVVKYE